MDKMKQTAVDWLINEWMHLDAEFDMVLIDKNTYWGKLKEKHNQAKEMHREEIINTYIDASENPALILDDAEEYYNKTFKNK